MTEGVLAAYEPVYARLGANGWGPQEVDGWEVWLVARFMGDEDFPPVIRGNRGLVLPSDNQGHGPRTRGTHGRFDPSRARPRSSDPGKIFTGDAAR
jgi:hypothetical protein